MIAAFAFLCASVGLLAGFLTDSGPLLVLAFWVFLVAFGALFHGTESI